MAQPAALTRGTFTKMGDAGTAGLTTFNVKSYATTSFVFSTNGLGTAHLNHAQLRFM